MPVMVIASGRRTLHRAALAAVAWFFVAGPAAAEPPSPSFALIGHLETLSLGSPPEAATMKVRGIKVTLPQSLLVTMPGQYLLVRDLFRGPLITGSPGAQSGLALLDNPPPRVPFEVEVIGNIYDNKYIAAVMRLSQGALHSGAGFIQNIDRDTGELRIGVLGGAEGARVRLNDPTGIYGLANDEGAKSAIVLDKRFSLDPENSPVHASTGFPVCVPRPGGDPKCPASNRTTPIRRFTCTKTNRPASTTAPVQDCDPRLPVPLKDGDYVTYAGLLQADGNGGFLIAAHGLTADLGIYTSPGADPAYLFIEEAIQGTKGELFSTIPPSLPGSFIPQEETTRFRVVGFTTDPSRNVEISIIDSDRIKGDASDAQFMTSFTGPAGLTPSNGPQLGRFRNTWPSKDDARAVRRDVLAKIIGPRQNGFTASGSYVAPINEYIYPEATEFGNPGFPLPVPAENFCFLSLGGGSIKSDGTDVDLNRLDPSPQSGHTLSQPVGAGPERACDGQ
jgi:hypothetical protein